jgi:hypothetical protein
VDWICIYNFLAVLGGSTVPKERQQTKEEHGKIYHSYKSNEE